MRSAASSARRIAWYRKTGSVWLGLRVVNIVVRHSCRLPAVAHSLLILSMLGLWAWPTPSWPADETLVDVDQLGAKLVRTLDSAGTGVPREVLFSPSDCHDATTGISAPLAVALREGLREPLLQGGYALVKPRQALGNVWVLRCKWRFKPDRQRLSVSFTAMPWRDGERASVQVFSSQLPASAAIMNLLRPDAASYGRTLVHQLERDQHLVEPKRIYLRPVQVAGIAADKAGSRPANTYFDAWLREAVRESHRLIPMDAPRMLAGLDRSTLRTRGFRLTAKTGMSLTGDLLAAQGELSGRVAPDPKAPSQDLRIDSLLQDEQGQALGEARIDLPLNLLPAAVAADLEQSASAILAADSVPPRGDFRFELSTNRGEGRVRFRFGERIAFLARVDQDAYVYLFNIDADDRATLLYPAFGVAVEPLPAGQLLLLPDDGLPYELEVTEPPGQDLVWAVATPEPLALPDTLDGDWMQADTLMARVREMGAAQAAFAEARLVLQTGP